ncbi:MAG: hypothetical protein IIC01_09940 [Planctomycetes bacterium]|nr:hypothetical protein [Planctomycetota bacterium]
MLREMARLDNPASRIVVVEASLVGLARWIGQIGAIHYGRTRSHLNRVGHPRTVAD